MFTTLLSLSAGLLLFGLCLAALRFYAQVAVHAIEALADPPQSEFCPSVTLLKSVCEFEASELEDSYANLASFCQQDYPHYCIQLVVQDSSASGLKLVQRLIQQFPQRDIQLVSRIDLSQVRQRQQTQLWLLADGHLKVEPDYLCQMVQPFRAASVGVVGCARVMHPASQFSTLRAIERYIGALVCRSAELPLAGSSLAIRTELLVKLADAQVHISPSCNLLSYSLSELIAAICYPAQWTALGYRTVLAGCAVEQDLAQKSAWCGLKQQISEAQARRIAYPQRYWQQGLRYGLLYGLLLLALTQGTVLGWTMLGWTMLGCTWIAEWAVTSWVGWGWLKQPAWRIGWLLPLYSLLSFCVWLCGFGGQKLAQPVQSQLSYVPTRQLSLR